MQTASRVDEAHVHCLVMWLSGVCSGSVALQGQTSASLSAQAWTRHRCAAASLSARCGQSNLQRPSLVAPLRAQQVRA